MPRCLVFKLEQYDFVTLFPVQFGIGKVLLLLLLGFLIRSDGLVCHYTSWEDDFDRVSCLLEISSYIIIQFAKRINIAISGLISVAELGHIFFSLFHTFYFYMTALSFDVPLFFIFLRIWLPTVHWSGKKLDIFFLQNNITFHINEMIF